MSGLSKRSTHCCIYVSWILLPCSEHQLSYSALEPWIARPIVLTKFLACQRAHVSMAILPQKSVVPHHGGKSRGSFVCAWRTSMISSKCVYFSPIALFVTASRFPVLSANFKHPNNGAASLSNILAVDPVFSCSCRLHFSKSDLNNSRCALAATIHPGTSSVSLR